MNVKLTVIVYVTIYICVIVSFTEGISADLLNKAVTIAGKCNQQYPLTTREIEKALKTAELPKSEDGKCFLSCVLEGFGLIADGQIDLGNSYQFNKMQFDDPDQLEKANGISAACKEELSSSAVEGCDFAIVAAGCILQKAKDFGFKYFQFHH